jgi:hypothetical protein
VENLFRSGFGYGRFQKSDPDPQHWLVHSFIVLCEYISEIFCLDRAGRRSLRVDPQLLSFISGSCDFTSAIFLICSRVKPITKLSLLKTKFDEVFSNFGLLFYIALSIGQYSLNAIVDTC